MDNAFKSVIDSSKSLQIILPTRPFFDQVAAGLSLFLATRPLKDVQIYSPSEMTVAFNRLIGVDKVSNELGNKNLTFKFTSYPADNIERVSYDIEDKEFRLTVIPKPGVISPNEDQIDISYSGISADTVVLIGGANANHFPSVFGKKLESLKIVHVGIRELSVPQETGIMSFARPASSSSEIIASLLKDNQFEIDRDIATNLLMGIEEGSSNFSGGDVTAETFELIAHLMKRGGRRKVEQKIPDRSKFPPGAIPARSGLDLNPPPPKQEDYKEDVVKKEDPFSKDWTGPKIYKGDSLG